MSVKNITTAILPWLPSGLRYWAFRRLLGKAKSDLKRLSPKCSNYVGRETARIRAIRYPTQTERPLVVGMIGLPQTGKTTAAEVMATEASLVHVNSNLVRNWLIDAGLDYSHISEIALWLIDQALDAGYNVVWDSDCVLPAKRALLESVVGHYGGKTWYVATEVDGAIWVERARSNAFTGNIHRMYHDGIRRGTAKYRDPAVPIPWEDVYQCVSEEYARQMPGHDKYTNTILRSILRNSGIQLQLQDDARNVARKLLARYGTEETKVYVRTAHDITFS